MKYTLFLFVFLFTHALHAAFPLHYFSFTSQAHKQSMAYVYEIPAGKTKSTVLLLHGKNFSHAYWQTTMSWLLQNGYAVIAPDQLGFGNSGQPEHYQYSFQQLALNTKLLLDSLHITQVTVLGHSMGGMLAVRFALMYPDICSRLILENPIGLEDWKTQVPYSSVDAEFKKEMKKTREELKTYMLKNYFHGEWKPEYESLLDESARQLFQKDRTAYARNMALTSDMIFTQPVCYELGNLKMPVSLIIGQKDRTAIGKERADPGVAEALGNYPVLGKRAAAAIANCRLLELAEPGHIPHVENFGQFTGALTTALQN